MALTKAKRKPAGYELDFHRWALDQAAALEDKRWQDVDWDNVAEEIESLGRNDRRSLEAHLEILLAHLLKWMAQPERRTRSWDLTIREQRRRIAQLIERSPSLRSHPAEYFAEIYADARRIAVRDTGLDDEAFPSSCPFTLDEALDPAFFPPKRGSAAR